MLYNHESMYVSCVGGTWIWYGFFLLEIKLVWLVPFKFILGNKPAQTWVIKPKNPLSFDLFPNGLITQVWWENYRYYQWPYYPSTTTIASGTCVREANWCIQLLNEEIDPLMFFPLVLSQIFHDIACISLQPTQTSSGIWARHPSTVLFCLFFYCFRGFVRRLKHARTTRDFRELTDRFWSTR